MNRLVQGSLLLIVFLIGACGSLPEIQSGSVSDREQRIKSYLDAVVESKMTPGVQYVVVDKDRILFQYATGKATVNASPMSLRTPMMLYSATKLFTAVAVLQLAEQDKLQLDEPMSKYLPDIPYKTVTVRQVLSHRSGIPDPIIGNMYVHPEHEHSSLDRAGMLRETLRENAKLKFEPGSDRKYSNLGYALLGELIVKLSGVSYEAYITEHILKPLDMQTGASFSFDDFEEDSRGYVRRYTLMSMAMGLMLDNFTPLKEGDWKTFKERWYFNFPAHGGLIADAPSSSRFVQAMLAEDAKILSPEMKTEFFEIQGEWDSSLLNSTHNALAWFYNQQSDLPFYFHEGSAFGYITELRVYPDAGIASVLLVNSTQRDHKEVMDSIDREFVSQ